MGWQRVEQQQEWNTNTMGSVIKKKKNCQLQQHERTWRALSEMSDREGQILPGITYMWNF